MNECILSYRLLDAQSQEFEAVEEAEASLTQDRLKIKSSFGETLSVPFRDFVELSGYDYKIQIVLTSGDKLVLYNLGYRYEDFLRELSKSHNALVLKDMLVNEKPVKSGIEGVFSYTNEAGETLNKGPCELRIYETALVIVPEASEIVRLPQSYITTVTDENYTVKIESEFGEKITVSMLGSNYDPFKNALSKMMHELTVKSQASLKELFPEADPMIIRRVARVMREGKAARRAELESISPMIWETLEKKIDALGIKEEYEYLKSLSQLEKICIGIKRGLMGDLTGEYLWFLIPIYSTDHGKPGNAVAMEASTGEGGGKATYFFRIVGRREYPSYINLEDLHRVTDDLITTINRCMLDTNFRREPIYLPEASLREPRYSRYWHAVKRMPSLRTLRSLFIGRVSHLSPEQWKRDVMDLLKFNVEMFEDEVSWRE